MLLFYLMNSLWNSTGIYSKGVSQEIYSVKSITGELTRRVSTCQPNTISLLLFNVCPWLTNTIRDPFVCPYSVPWLVSSVVSRDRFNLRHRCWVYSTPVTILTFIRNTKCVRFFWCVFKPQSRYLTLFDKGTFKSRRKRDLLKSPD